jgi:hypothetical protein
MLTLSRRLGQTLLTRSIATAATATASKVHADPATLAVVEYNLQERDRIDNSISANRDLIHENHKYMNKMYDDHRQQMDAKLNEKLGLVDDKLDSALERFIKSNESLKADMATLKTSLKTEATSLNGKIESLQTEFRTLDKSVTFVGVVVVVIISLFSMITVLYIDLIEQKKAKRNKLTPAG